MGLPFYFETVALIWLNPLILFPYFAFAAERDSLAQRFDGNCTRLRVIPYVLIAPLVLCTAIAFMYLVLSSINPQLDWRVFLEPSGSWVFYTSTAIATLSAGVLFSRKGLEGNIGGFIFAPFWLFSIVATVVVHVRWLNRVAIG